MSRGFKKISKILLVLTLVFVFTSAPVPASLNFSDLTVHAQQQPYWGGSEITERVAAERAGDDGSCSLFKGLTGIANCLGMGIYIIFSINSFILIAVANFFDEILKVLVFDMSQTIDNIKVLEEIWVVFRDLANILFIFVLLYAAIRIIIDSGTGSVGKLIGKVILIAVLINFSLFITKAVIDSSNILALQFRNAITTDKNGDSVSVGTNLSYSFGIHTILGKESLPQSGSKLDTIIAASKTFNKIDGIFHKAQILILGNVMSLIAMFTLLLASLMLLFRFMMLIVLMILSPVAFVANIIPQTSTYSTKWWSMLIKESFYAPIFLLFLWLTLKIVNSSGFSDAIIGKGEVTNLSITGGDLRSASGSYISVLLVIGLLLSSVLIGKFLGNKFSGTAMKLAKNTRDFVTKPARAAVSTANREIVGGTLERMRKSEGMGKLATSTGMKGVAGRYMERKLNSNKIVGKYRAEISDNTKQHTRIVSDTASRAETERGRIQMENDEREDQNTASREEREALTQPFQSEVNRLENDENELQKDFDELASVVEERTSKEERLDELKDKKRSFEAVGSTLSAKEEAEIDELGDEVDDLEDKEIELERKIRDENKTSRIAAVRASLSTARTGLASIESSPSYQAAIDSEEKRDRKTNEEKARSQELKKEAEKNKRELENRAVASFSSSKLFGLLPLNTSGNETADKIRESSRKRRKAKNKEDARDKNKKLAEERVSKLEQSRALLVEKVRRGETLSDADQTELESLEIKIFNLNKEIYKDSGRKDGGEKGGGGGGDKEGGDGK